MRCKNCGNENPEGSKFCQHCGTSIAEDHPSVDKKPYSISIKTILIIIAIALWMLVLQNAGLFRATQKVYIVEEDTEESM